MTAARLPTAEIMDKLQLSNPTLNLWRNRYLELGLAGLEKGKRIATTSPLACFNKAVGFSFNSEILVENEANIGA